MTKQAVFGSKYSAKRIRIFEKKRIVPDTQSQQNIKLRFLIIEQERLKNWIAHGFKAAGADFLMVLNADFFWIVLLSS